MASISLTEVWIHQANDISTLIKLLDATSIGINAEIAGSIKNTPTGRKWITTGVTWQDIQVTALHVLRSDVDILYSWIGDLVVLRDPTGRQVWGIYKKLNVKESSSTELVRVSKISFTLNEVLGDAAV